jgi:hypothetical protein
MAESRAWRLDRGFLAQEWPSASMGARVTDAAPYYLRGNGEVVRNNGLVIGRRKRSRPGKTPEKRCASSAEELPLGRAFVV